jgi:GGDEF domain-containing protein
MDSDELTAWRTALRIVEAALASSFELAGTRIQLSVAVGVSVIKAGDDPKGVISRADMSMYKIKRA